MSRQRKKAEEKGPAKGRERESEGARSEVRSQNEKEVKTQKSKVKAGRKKGNAECEASEAQNRHTRRNAGSCLKLSRNLGR